MFKTTNVGKTDRILRLVAGAILVLLPFVTSLAASIPAGQIVLPVVGAVLIVTALMRCCPLYRLIGVNTCRID